MEELVLPRALENAERVLVDGGTDILMRGDEAELGTPTEDATSLAAVSTLTRSVATKMPEVQLYLEAVEAADAATPSRPSIVNGSIASAVQGHFGDHHRSARTKSSTLFINPLMSLVWAFDLDAVAKQNLYLHALAHTEAVWDVQTLIEAFHQRASKRPRVPFPH